MRHMCLVSPSMVCIDCEMKRCETRQEVYEHKIERMNLDIQLRIEFRLDGLKTGNYCINAT